MPPKFERCVDQGGKVRTVKPSASTYVHVCKPPGADKTIAGEVKRTKGAKSKLRGVTS